MSFSFENEYPKTVKLNDGSKVVFRLLGTDDQQKLHDFFMRLPEDDLMYLRDNVKDPKVVEKWVSHVDYSRIVPIVAEANDQIISDATLHMDPHTWYRHVGSLRLVVDKNYRSKGLGHLLAKELFFVALQLKLEKLQVEMVADQVHARRVFEALGFEQEALLQNHVLDRKGGKRHLVIMSNHVESLWDRIQDGYMDSSMDFSGM
jgi:L-amino acid N-acyltransferase YncA